MDLPLVLRTEAASGAFLAAAAAPGSQVRQPRSVDSGVSAGKENQSSAPVFRPGDALKEKKMKSRVPLWLSVPAMAGLLAFAVQPALAQTPAPGATGSIHGHVTNPTGAATTTGNVSLSTDGGHTSKYTFQVDANGDYKGADVAAGTYMVIFRQPDTPPDKMVDSFDNVKIAAGQDTAQDIDMSRQAFIDKLSPDQRKQLEELRSKNAEAMKTNEIIKGLNADLHTAGQDIKDADGATPDVKTQKYTEVETLMLKDTQAKPDASVLWAELSQAQVGLKKYDDAITSSKKALDLEASAKKPSIAVQGLANSELGESYARQGKVPEANAAFDEAAKVNPTQAFFYYKNEAVIFFQANNADAQVAAANQALKTDPNNAGAAVLYYLIGQGLVQKATMAPDPSNPKVQRIVLPPGCAEAYEKYLELAPNGPYAADAKGILEQAGQKVSSTYKAGKKS
jgi:tetratricopeptide (TPR) repeat protein